jgi:hypothetical protein
MRGTREPKKCETLEVRLPYEAKIALMNKAHSEGKSASEVIRESIDSYLASQPTEARSMLLTLWKPAAVIGAASLAFMSVALLPTPSQAQPDLKSVFHMLDRNHDGMITADEFIRDASDHEVQKMHHAHMAKGDAKQMGEMHGQMMQSAHGKPSDDSLRSHFAQLDANSDGSVTFAEFQAFHDKMKAAHKAH